MSTTLNELNADLHDLAGVKQHRFEHAQAAEQILLDFVRTHGNQVEPALSIFSDWWGKKHPARVGQLGDAEHHALMSVICAVRSFGEMGS